MSLFVKKNMPWLNAAPGVYFFMFFYSIIFLLGQALHLYLYCLCSFVVSLPQNIFHKKSTRSSVDIEVQKLNIFDCCYFFVIFLILSSHGSLDIWDRGGCLIQWSPSLFVNYLFVCFYFGKTPLKLIF